MFYLGAVTKAEAARKLKMTNVGVNTALLRGLVALLEEDEVSI